MYKMKVEEDMEKLLVIGAGIGQIPIIRKAKEKSIHVTIATLPGKQPGIEIADDVIYMDIFDREGIADEARKRGITAVTSDQNDLMNPTVAYVAEKLGLPGNKYETVVSYCNKNTYRANCEKVGVPVPKHVAVNSADHDFSAFDCPLPWIVKPADSQSSVGVQRIDNMDELIFALEFALQKSKTHTAIVEEYFFGKEFVCEGFISDGKFYLLSFADRKYFELKDLLIPCQTLFPSNLDRSVLDKVVSYESKMAEYTKPAFAIVHSEYLVNEKTGEIRAVESALRGGGVYISSHLIPLSTGIDINEVLLNKALGIDVDVDKIFAERIDKAAGYVCFYLPEGKISSISGVEELKQLPFVKMAKIDDLEVGQETEKILHKGLRKGPILVCGDDRSDLEKNIKIVQNTLKIEVENNSGQKAGIIWK